MQLCRPILESLKLQRESYILSIFTLLQHLAYVVTSACSVGCVFCTTHCNIVNLWQSIADNNFASKSISHTVVKCYWFCYIDDTCIQAGFVYRTVYPFQYCCLRQLHNCLFIFFPLLWFPHTIGSCVLQLLNPDSHD